MHHTVALRVASNNGPAGRRGSALPRRRMRRKAAYAIPVPMPSTTPSCGFAPNAPAPMTPLMSTTPRSTTGTAAATRADGRSDRTSQAMSGTITTCVLPRTVASPAPTAAMAWCHRTRSMAKKTPASHASVR